MPAHGSAYRRQQGLGSYSQQRQTGHKGMGRSLAGRQPNRACQYAPERKRPPPPMAGRLPTCSPPPRTNSAAGPLMMLPAAAWLSSRWGGKEIPGMPRLSGGGARRGTPAMLIPLSCGKWGQWGGVAVGGSTRCGGVGLPFASDASQPKQTGSSSSSSIRSRPTHLRRQQADAAAAHVSGQRVGGGARSAVRRVEAAPGRGQASGREELQAGRQAGRQKGVRAS